MKTIFAIAASLAVLICGIGCPAGGGNSDGNKPVTATSANTPGGTVTTESGLTDSGSGNETEIGLGSMPTGEFGFDGVYLGLDSSMLKGRFVSLGLTTMGMWVDRDWTGRLDGSPLSGEAFPAEAGWFLDGKLVGFISTVDGSKAGFDETCAHQSELYGEPLTSIPNWAQESEFFAGFDYQGEEEGVAIWCDAASRGMLFVTFDPLEESITTMLVDVDNYRDAMETTNEAIGAQGHGL